MSDLGDWQTLYAAAMLEGENTQVRLRIGSTIRCTASSTSRTPIVTDRPIPTRVERD